MVIYNDANNFILEDEDNDISDDDDVDKKNVETNKSIEVNSFNRLYYDGLQQKISRQ